jgi:uncharacterized protein (DUF427 family)
MTGDIKVPGPDHPITIDTDSVRVAARVGDTVIADTDHEGQSSAAGRPSSR